jgi:hypothetical protein
MRNEESTVIKKKIMGLGVGLLEYAIEAESAKGCSSILCQEPVELEPPYQVFDSQAVLNGPWDQHDSTEEVTLRDSTGDRGPMVTFVIYAAAEDLLTAPWMESFMRAISALKGRIAFELCGGGGRVMFRFAIPENEVPALQRSVNGLFPGIRLVQDASPFPVARATPGSQTDLRLTVEELAAVPPYHRSLTLLGKDGPSPLGIVASSIAAVGSGDFAFYQVLLKPADPAHDWHYNVANLAEAEVRARELKLMGGLSTGFAYDQELPPLEEPSVQEKVRRDVAFFATVIRYGVWSEDPTSIDAYLQGCRAAAAMVRFGNRPFRTLSKKVLVSNLGADRVQNMVVERLTHRPGLMLTSQEIVSLAHIPNARTLEMFSCIEQRAGLEWSGPESVSPQTDGSAVLGTNDYAGDSKQVAILQGSRALHMVIAGVTGTGKSTLQQTVIVSDAAAGLGLCLIDPHGDLANEVLSRLPESRMKDLVVVTFTEPGLVPRWNPFRSAAPSGKVADDVTRAFAATSSTLFGPRMEHVTRSVVYVVHRLGGTLQDFAELVGRSARGEALRKRALEAISSDEIQRFLGEELPNYKPSDLDSVRNKLSRLLLDDVLGEMFRQPENDLNPRAWMDEGKVVIVNLSSGRIGTDHARFVGGLLVSLMYRAALSRVDMPPAQRRPFMLYIDECQLLQTGTLEGILSEGRKYGLNAILAHQENGQLSADLVQALGNCGTRVVFRPTPDDAPKMRRVLLNRVTEADLLKLGVGEAYVAHGEHVASLRTSLCPYPILRDGGDVAAAYAKAHYARIAEAMTLTTPKPKGRPRQVALFGKEE